MFRMKISLFSVNKVRCRWASTSRRSSRKTSLPITSGFSSRRRRSDIIGQIFQGDSRGWVRRLHWQWTQMHHVTLWSVIQTKRTHSCQTNEVKTRKIRQKRSNTQRNGMSAGDKRDLQTLAIDTLDEWLLLWICSASYAYDMPFPRAVVGAEKSKNHYSRCHSHHSARVIIQTTTFPRTDRNEDEDEQRHEAKCSLEEQPVPTLVAAPLWEENDENRRRGRLGERMRSVSLHPSPCSSWLFHLSTILREILLRSLSHLRFLSLSKGELLHSTGPTWRRIQWLVRRSDLWYLHWRRSTLIWQIQGENDCSSVDSHSIGRGEESVDSH